MSASELEKFKPKIFHVDPSLNSIGQPLNKTNQNS
ncbi:Uncharacterised protein [Mycoplasmoides gallisepticum]|uniref:Uncharacterized protein n=1 Tax=Mycoplasmoides gallisepticum TaxID=2096 RepID=A0A3B0Q5L5_MYCGL|nr:Uncharacterised protein [Mycoplasmoides gallisepticum]